MIKRFIYGVILIIMCTCLLSIGVYAADEVASGACGDNLTWTLYADGEIVIEGTGAMWDYNSYSNPAPWADRTCAKCRIPFSGKSCRPPDRQSVRKPG